MTSISLRLPPELLDETDRYAKKTHVSRTSYIRKAIREMNAAMLAKRRRNHLIEASYRVRKESLRVNKQFSDIENDPEA